MSLTDSEKSARRERARRRREAKAAGTYVPKRERKEKRRQQREEDAKRMQERIKRKLEDSRGSDGKIPRLKKPITSAGVLRHFADGEIVLIKAKITGIVHPGDTGQTRYYVQPIESPNLIDKYENSWLVRQSCLAKWPKKKKKGK